jgi:hypothetical protein
MRQSKLAMSMTVVVVAAFGCAQNNDAERTATKVVRPDEVKISLGHQAESTDSAPPAEQPVEKPDAAEGQAP